ncbi:MAG: hypothetical protein EA401_10655 [Planctomycetota bacterium]|nr:MAG: hypothetical protein EA401_10655 [Planctomycetota bacterium]
MKRTVSDIQETIDTLFTRLEECDDPGKVQQLTHALRHQVTKKAAAGGHLQPREQALIDAVGSIRTRRHRSWTGVLILAVLLALAVLVAWWWLVPVPV